MRLMTSGVRERDTKVATWSPARAFPGKSGPMSFTRPSSMPPEPVTGFCSLPRVLTMSRIIAAILSLSAPQASLIWVKEAESTLSVSTEMSISLACMGRRLSIRRAAWGRAPLGFSTRWVP